MEKREISITTHKGTTTKHYELDFYLSNSLKYEDMSEDSKYYYSHWCCFLDDNMYLNDAKENQHLFNDVVFFTNDAIFRYVSKCFKDFIEDLDCLDKEDISNFTKNYASLESALKIKIYTECYDESLALEKNRKFLELLKSPCNTKKKDNSGYVYLIKSEYGVKIGMSRKPKRRFSQIQTLMPFKCDMLFFKHVSHASKCEKYLHGFFSKYRINGEWFCLSDELIDKAKKLACSWVEE